MPSPFASLENATLTFKSSSQSMEVDEWGNRLPVQEDLVVRCWLAVDSKGGSVQDYAMAGVDESEQTLKGYCVDPMFLPDVIAHGSEAIATIGSAKGRFILYRGIEGIATPVTGSPLNGIFRRQV